ncbi:hypothetical protein [Vibrio salilacus]|uniref:hypothetical protein n=1 Tax=Vibrio salilacus TaxID=1323749 RepID=UPI0012FE22B9|nr:hypothetical protein [Vibrio salilacus]
MKTQRHDEVAPRSFEYTKDQQEQVIGIGSGLTLKKAINRIDFESPNSKEN